MRQQIPARCITHTSNPLIVLEERRSKITFHNPQRRDVTMIKVDGCAITDGPRCDHLLKDEGSTEHFIELKGTDVRHAIEQLEASIKQLSDDIAKAKYSFVITTHVPKSDTRIQRAKPRFHRDYNCELIVKNSPHTVTI